MERRNRKKRKMKREGRNKSRWEVTNKGRRKKENTTRIKKINASYSSHDPCKSYDYYRRHIFLFLTLLVFSFFLLPLFVPSHLDLFLLSLPFIFAILKSGNFYLENFKQTSKQTLTFLTDFLKLPYFSAIFLHFSILFFFSFTHSLFFFSF